MSLFFFQMNFPSSILPSVDTVYVEDEKPEKSSKQSPPQGLNSSDAAFHKACFVSSFERE